MKFEVDLTFTDGAVSGLESSNPDVEGGFEYRLGGEDPFKIQDQVRPTNYDFLGMAVRSLLVTAIRISQGEESRHSYLAWAGYFAFCPTNDGVNIGTSRTSGDKAMENVGEYEATADEIINEALRVSEEFIAVAVGVNGELDSHPRIEELREYREELLKLVGEFE